MTSEQRILRILEALVSSGTLGALVSSGVVEELVSSGVVEALVFLEYN